MAEAKKTSNAGFAIAIWAAILVTVFVAFRSTDLLRLPSLVGNLGGGPLFGGEGVLASLVGAVVSCVILVSWLGVGTFVFRYLKTERSDNHSRVLEIVRNIAVGAAITSLLWFFLGLAGLFSPIAAVIITVVGLVEGGLSVFRVLGARNEDRVPEKTAVFDRALLLLTALPLALAFIASLAPPIAKDSLLYHFSLPKAFISQGGSAFIQGNIASYLALGTEMHAVWAMLLGSFVSPRAGEAASGAVVFLFFPLLLAAIYGWAREIGITKRWSLVATLMVAAVPTAFHVGSSGYVDLALALFITLAIRSLCRWWKFQDTQSIVLIAIFLGAALSIKLTTVFVIAAFALIVLLRARGAKNPVAIAPGSDSADDSTAMAPGAFSPGRIVLGGFAALLLAGVFASPWYVRNWVATGSPVFPFYMSIWKGAAEGWDVERSNLFQGMNSQYGGAAANPVNYLTAPLRVSLAAQPEDPPLYDGVLGPMFLIGLPLLIWAFWKREVAIEAKIAAGVAGVMFLFWLFSSAQLRYLLPIVPALAVAIAASVESLSGRRYALNKAAKFSLAGASIVCIATSFAWFCQKAPLRVVLGGETRDQYLTRNLDYYPFYQAINSDTPTDAKVWLINMRRDTYPIERPVFSDYLFEDWTLRKMVWESRSSQELRAKAAAMGIQYVLTRHDFLFDYSRSTLVDDKKPRAENEAKLKIAKEFILDPANTVKADSKFSLIKVF
ncbi:MAG: glycosyltransferase family 39 protein [Acidobacteria bacterium]|nr:glycosyltransferase family 39 protein [Acidobacteriota bacterium]